MSGLLRLWTQRSIGVDTVPMEDLFFTVLAELQSLHQERLKGNSI